MRRSRAADQQAGNTFFLSGVSDADPVYIGLRDSEHRAQDRQLVESQWIRFRRFCSGEAARFRSEAARGCDARLWEMSLGCLLLDNGHRLEKPTHREDAPDIKVVGPSGAIWIEATMAERGQGPDAVEEPPVIMIDDATTLEGAFSADGIMQPFTMVTAVVPDHARMILRYAAALKAKNAQFSKFEQRGYVQAGEPTVVAMCAAPIPNGDIEHACLPDIVKAVFGLAEAQYVVPVLGASGPIDIHASPRDKITKQSGITVPSTWFSQRLAPNVSAVIFFPYSPLRVHDARSVIIVHNPCAQVVLPRGTFRFGREWWVTPETSETGRLHCYGWRDIPRWARGNTIAPIAMKVVVVAERFHRRWQAAQDRLRRYRKRGRDRGRGFRVP